MSIFDRHNKLGWDRMILSLGALIRRIFSVVVPKFVRILSTMIYARVAIFSWIAGHPNVKWEGRLDYVPRPTGPACPTSWPRSDRKSEVWK